MGHRRCQAYRLLAEEFPERFAHIPALISQDLEDDEIKEIQLIENIQRENLSARDVAETLRYFRSKGLSHKEIAKKLGKSLGYVKNLSSTVKTIDDNSELATLVEDYQSISLTDLQEVTGLPIRPRMRLLKARATGEIRTVKELRQAVADWKLESAGQDDESEMKPAKVRKKRTLASCIRLEDDSIVFLPMRLTPAELSESQKQELRNLLNQALLRLGV